MQIVFGIAIQFRLLHQGFLCIVPISL